MEAAILIIIVGGILKLITSLIRSASKKMDDNEAYQQQKDKLDKDRMKYGL